MDKNKLKAIAIGLAIVLPVVLVFTVPEFLDWLNLSREKSHQVRLPPKLFATGAKDTVDADGKKRVDSIYHFVPNYTFQTHNGDSLELDSMRGSLYVADFFFATCPGICPKLSRSMSKVQETFIKDTQLKLLSFTVDPDRDSLPALKEYAYNHNAIPGKWYFLRGPQQDIFKLAHNGFYITAKPDEDGGPEAFVHSEKLVLVDWEGNIRGYYSGVDSASVNKLMADIILLLRANEKRFRMNVRR